MQKLSDTLPIPIGTQIDITYKDIAASDNPIRYAIEQKYDNVLDIRIQHGMAYIAIGKTGNVKTGNYNLTKRLFEWVLAEYENPLSIEPITIGVTYLKYKSARGTSRHMTIDIVTKGTK